MKTRTALLLLAGLWTADSALAEPVYKDRERFGEAGYGGPPAAPPPHPTSPLMGHRTVGDAGYVGSDYGLGKPSFTGLGSRPDWGRNSD